MVLSFHQSGSTKKVVLFSKYGLKSINDQELKQKRKVMSEKKKSFFEDISEHRQSTNQHREGHEFS